MKGNGANPELPWIVYLSPATGFMSMLSNQIGMVGQMVIWMTNMDISKYAEYISIAIQLGLSVIFIYLSAIKLNPLNTKRDLKVFKRKKL